MLVTIRNVTFGRGDQWMVKYADVIAVRDRTLCEVLFKGTVADCNKFIEKNRYEQTAAPTCPFMRISRMAGAKEPSRPAVKRIEKCRTLKLKSGASRARLQATE